MNDDVKNLSDAEKAQKIQSLRDMITSAEQTIQSAKSMLLQIEGKKKAGRKRKIDDEDGKVIQGTFDGQIMVGTDGKQYPIPANYASKSKLVEGDLLKLTIVPDGSFVYKQIGPIPRMNKIGIVGQDAHGNYFVAVDGKPYKVLLASITYFGAQPGDEVAIVTSQEESAQWAAIEAVLQQNNNPDAAPAIASLEKTPEADTPKTANAILTGSADSSLDAGGDILDESQEKDNGNQILDEWMPDIDEIEKEIRAEMKQTE